MNFMELRLAKAPDSAGAMGGAHSSSSDGSIKM